MSNATSSTCPSCNTIVAAESPWCPKCGKPVPSAVVHAQPAAPPSPRPPGAPSVTFVPPKNTGVTSGTALMVVASVLIGVGALSLVTQATLGVAGVAFAILCAIWARLIQARAQHAHMVDVINAQRGTKP